MYDRPEPPPRPEAITPGWVAAVLETRVGHSVDVDAVDVELIGGGFLGTVGRIEISSADPDVPASLIAKFAHPDPATRAEVWDADIYQLESRFYTDLRPAIPLATPTPWFVETDRRRDRHLIVVDDLSSLTLHQQVIGCPPERAFDVVADLALLHGTFWGGGGALADALRASVDDAAWVELYCSGIPAMLERDDLTPTQRRLTEVYAEAGPRSVELLDQHRTVTHGDARIENVFFAPDGSRVWIDWDGIQLGGAGFDLAYFIHGSLRTEVRRSIEADLIAHYVDTLGQPGYGVGEAWADYRRGVVASWSVALAVVGVYGPKDAEAAAMVAEVMARIAAALDDLDAIDEFV